MLIVSESGEQRLITFTLPKESCTVQELLEQIGVPFEPDANIHCAVQPGLNIDYLVTIGVNLTETPTEIITAAENSMQMKQHEQQIYQNSPQPMQVVPNHAQSSPVQPKIVLGMFALCAACGYTGQNHAQCQRLVRIN